MIVLKAHFDGRVLVPEEAVELPLHRTLEIRIEDAAANGASATASGDTSLLAGLDELLASLPDDPATPTDLAAQHDHYLHGTPKRP